MNHVAITIPVKMNALILIYHIMQPLKEHKNTMEAINVCRCLLAVFLESQW